MTEKLCGIYFIENIIDNKKYIGISRNIKSAGKHPVTGEKLTWEIIEK